MIRSLMASLKLLFFCAFAASATAGEQPNILLIYVDDLGYGDVGCYGAKRIQTPNVDRLATEGLRFTDGHCTSSTCTPSRYALLTGEYPWRKKGTGVLPGDAGLIIEPNRGTLPLTLQKAGYTTGVIGKWHLGLGQTGMLDWNELIRPGAREVGFTDSFIMAATGDRVPCVYVQNSRVVGLDPADPIIVSYAAPIPGEPTGRENPEMLKMKTSLGHDMTIVNGISRIGYMKGGHSARWKDEDMADSFTREGMQFIERHKDKPFFLYFATHDIHVPRVPHPRFVGKSGMGPRGDAIAEMDWCVGELLNTLDRLKLAEKTMVIFSSDNGPVLDDGYKDDAVEKLGDHQPAGSWRGGKYSIYEGGTRVPFLVRWPGRVKPGESTALISQIDLLASLAALAGTTPEVTATDSQNILPALLGESPTGREILVEHSGNLALRKGSWKFVERRAQPKAAAAKNPPAKSDSPTAPQGELYDLAADPGETHNLAGEKPDKLAELSAELDKIKAAGRMPEALTPKTNGTGNKEVPPAKKPATAAKAKAKTTAKGKK